MYRLLLAVVLLIVACSTAAWCGGAGDSERLLRLVPDNPNDPVLVASLPSGPVTFDGLRGRVELVGAVKDGAIVPIGEVGLRACDLQFVVFPTKKVRFVKSLRVAALTMHFAQVERVTFPLGAVEKQSGKLIRAWWAKEPIDVRFGGGYTYPKGPNNRLCAAISPLR